MSEQRLVQLRPLLRVAADEHRRAKRPHRPATRPTPSPHFYPPPRDATAEQVEAAKYTWSWPEREKRAAAPQIKRPEKIAQSFLEEYEIRPPWLKY